MVQHQTDSSADNVTPSVQSWFHDEAAAERRAQSAAAWTRRVVMCAHCCQTRWAYLCGFRMGESEPERLKLKLPHNFVFITLDEDVFSLFI